jgi:hypothetical protein
LIGRKPIVALITALCIALMMASITKAEYNLPEAGVTPDSPLYGSDKAAEALQLTLALDPLDKAELHLQFAGERLAEAMVMANHGKFGFVLDPIQEYERNMIGVMKYIALAQEAGEDITEICELVQMATSKHQDVLAEVYAKMPEHTKPVIAHAKAVSARVQEEVAKRLKIGS